MSQPAAVSPQYHIAPPAPSEWDKAPAWMKKTPEGKREMCAKFRYKGLERAFDESEEDVIAEEEAKEQKKKRRRPKKKKKPKKNSPTAEEPWDWHRAKVVRHLWWWHADAPRCDVRETWFAEAHSRDLPTDDDDNGAEKALKLLGGGVFNIVLTLIDGLTGGVTGHVKRLQAAELEVALESTEWYPLYRLCPVKEDLETLLQRIPRTFGQYDAHLGGNFMWHCARRGDSLTCKRLLELGYGNLASQTAVFDGRTAFEIALCNGFPDTAFLLEPYSRILCTEHKRHVDKLLLDELTYICAQGDTLVLPKPQRRSNLIARLLLGEYKQPPKPIAL